MNISEIKKLFKKQGFLDASLVSLEKSLSFETYKAQIWNSNFGNMEYLKTHTDMKSPDKQVYKSALVALFPYYPTQNTLKSSLRIALYAQEEDYHRVVKEKLDHIIDDLKSDFPEENFKSCVDSYPVLERDLAYRAGLGWMGKNTCILTKEKGSLFYVCEILSSYNCKSTPELYSDHCGTCTKCIDACPTDALSPRKLDVDKCISYRNIEDKDSSVESLDKNLHGWLFGCDICQTVCPWNEKTHGKKDMQELTKDYTFSHESLEELKIILSSSNKRLMEVYKDFPINRARGTGLKRNALKLIHQNKITELKGFLGGLAVPEKLEQLKLEVFNSL